MTDSMTASSPTSSSEAASAASGSERPLEDLLARVPGELLAAERSHAEPFDELEHDFWTDPCRFLRRACQKVDYGSDELRA